MKDLVSVVLDPGWSARPGLVLLALWSPKLLGGPTAGSLFLRFLKSLAMLAELAGLSRLLSIDWYIEAGLSCCKIDDFPGSYSKILLGSDRNFLVSTFLSGGSQSCFSVEDRSLGRSGGTGGGTCGGGTGEDASLKASVPLSEWLLERGL